MTTISTRFGIECPLAVTTPPSKSDRDRKEERREESTGNPSWGQSSSDGSQNLSQSLVDPHFHKDSYGYREGKSAIDALEVTRQRCWQYDWVLEFDIKGLFDNIDHEHTNEGKSRNM